MSHSTRMRGEGGFFAKSSLGLLYTHITETFFKEGSVSIPGRPRFKGRSFINDDRRALLHF